MIQDKDYENYKKEMILRDRLAMDRTVMANERTFLAYIRTSLSVVVVGASFIKFLHSPIFHIMGWILIPLGLLLLGFGTQRYLQVRSVFQKLTQGQEEEQAEDTQTTETKSDSSS